MLPELAKQQKLHGAGYSQTVLYIISDVLCLLFGFCVGGLHEAFKFKKETRTFSMSSQMYETLGILCLGVSAWDLSLGIRCLLFSSWDVFVWDLALGSCCKGEIPKRKIPKQKNPKRKNPSNESKATKTSAKAKAKQTKTKTPNNAINKSNLVE